MEEWSASTCIICYLFSRQYRVKLREILRLRNTEAAAFERGDDDTQIAAAAAGERLRLASQTFSNFNLVNNK